MQVALGLLSENLRERLEPQQATEIEGREECRQLAFERRE